MANVGLSKFVEPANQPGVPVLCMWCAAPRFSTTNIFLSLERVKGVNTQNGFVDFTKEMKKDHVILVPDIFPVHMSLLTEVLRMYG